MPDPYSIPFKQADGNGHYKSKELPDDQADFLTQLGVPTVFGDVRTGETNTVTGQLTTWYGTDGHTIKAVPTSTSGIVVAQSGVATFEAHPAGAIVGTDAPQTLTNKTFGSGITFGAGTTFTGGVVGLTKNDVGLSNVDNTSDAQKNAAVATLTNKTLTNPAINNGAFSGTITGLTKANVGLGNVDNTSDLNKPISTATQSQLDLKENLNRYNTANGYAPLGSDSKVPLANLPDAVLGASKYQGTWNAATNIPPIPPAAPSNNGWYYVCNVAGNSNIDGINVWGIGDWVISNGGYWQKIPNTSAVISVNAKTGAVVLNKSDIGLSNVDNTSDATKNAAAATLTNKVINGSSNTLTVRLDADVVNNLPVSRLNGGTGASTATFWRGDGLWVSPTGAGDVQGPNTAVDGEVTVFSGATGKMLRVFGGAAGFAKVGPSAALTTVPTIGALDVNTSLVHGQVQKTSVTALDEFLLWDSVSSTLKSVRYSTVSVLPRNYLAGMTLANNASDVVNDLDIAVGECRDDSNTVDIALATPLTKRLDAAWAAGTAQGGRDTGAIADGPWHIYVIAKADRTTDVVMTTTYGSPTLPSGYVYKRRIGSIVRAAGVLRLFTQLGDYFALASPVITHSALAIAQSTNAFMNLALAVPTGLKFYVDAQLNVVHSASASLSFCYDFDAGPGAMAGIATSAGNVTATYRFAVWCTSAAQIRIAAGSQTGTFTFNLLPYGYWDPRDKDR